MLKFLLVLLTASIILASSLARANTKDFELFCRADKTLHVSNPDFQVTDLYYNDRYHFLNGKLYMRNGDGPEDYYNDLTEADPLKYSSGDKTILFDNEKKTGALIIHINLIEVYMARVKCSPK